MKSSSVVLVALLASTEAFTVRPRAAAVGMKTLCRVSEENTTPAATDDESTEEVPLDAVESLGRGAAKVGTKNNEYERNDQAPFLISRSHPFLC